MKFCSNCGQMVVPNAVACQSCGTPTQASAQSTDSQQFTEQQVSPNQQPQQPYSQQQPPYQQPQQPYDQQHPPYQQPQQPQQPFNQQQPFQQQPYNQQPFYAPPPYPQMDPALQRYTRMGGWLLFFTIGSILSAFVSFFTTISEIGHYLDLLDMIDDPLYFFPDPDAWATMAYIDIFAQILLLAAIVFQIIAIVQIFKRRATFLRFEQITWLISVVASIILVASISLVGFELFEDVPLMISSIVGSAVGIILRTLYYSKSVRVRTYMGSDEFKHKAIFAFNKSPAASPYHQ